MKPSFNQIEARIRTDGSGGCLFRLRTIRLHAARGRPIQKRQTQPVASIGLLAGPDHPSQAFLGREAIDGLHAHADPGADRFIPVADQAHSRERLVADEGGQPPLVTLHSRIGAVLRDTEDTLSLFASSGESIFVGERKDFLRVFEELIFPGEKPVAMLCGIGVVGSVSSLISGLHDPLKSKRRATELPSPTNFLEARRCNGF